MIHRHLCVRSRVFARIHFITIFAFALLLGGLGSRLLAAPIQQALVTGPKIWLRDNQPVQVKPVGSNLAEAIASGQAQPLSMASADVDGDGVADLVTGFSTTNGGAVMVQRGNLDAFAPQNNGTFQAIGHGQFPAPFLAKAQVICIPVRPDFIALGVFTPTGNQDLVVATRGGNSLYLFPGDGKGSFGTPQVTTLSGGVTSLAVERLLRTEPFTNVIVGVATPQISSLQVFTGSKQGLGSPAVFTTPGAPTNLVFGDFGDSHTDAAFLAGGSVFILHSASFQMEEISLPVNASAMALGSFVFDRNSALQIALLTSDGTIHIAAPAEFDPRPLTTEEHQARLHAARRGFPNPLNSQRSLPQHGWQIIESIASVAPFAAGQPPVFFRTRISDHPADDIMVINPSMSQLTVISHSTAVPGSATFEPAQVSTRPYIGFAVAALPMRTNIDNRPGVVALHQGQLEPAVMMPLPDPTFFVNRNDDPTPGTVAATCNNVSNADTSSSCSLREAVLKANATAGTDTITLAAGTYTLSIARQNGDNTGVHGGLYINDSVNIVGAGQANTIIQGGTSSATGVDLVFAVNEDIQTITNASASFTNLTIKFGHNRGSVGGFDGDGGCMEYDTGSSGAATLTLTNVTISNCVTQDGNGGGLVIFNASSGIAGGGTGLATIGNSTFQNNSVAEQGAGSAGSGGGIWVSDLSRMALSNSVVTSNTATQVNGGGRGVGGGIFIFSAGSGSRQTQIHATSVTNNSASGFGGGIWSSSNLLIDNTGGATVISGNAAGANGGGSQNGGGVYLNPASPDSTTLTKLTITGNSAAANGGGVASGNDTGAGALTMHFTRLAGNTATTAKNLDNDDTSINASNNWWGTNTPTNTIANRNGGTTTSSPFVKLTNTASPSTIKINQSSTLTGDLSKDNNGTALTGNLDVLVGLPITFNNAVLGTIPQAQPETLNSSAQATATFNAGGTAGNGSADATVDQQTVTANIVILAPLQITKSFNPTSVAINTPSTLSFAINNPNTIAVDASFTDTLPAGLVVAATPGPTNTCGGTLTATAGAGSISFSNASLPVGACSVTVKVSSATDGIFNNSVTINSTAAGTGAQSTSATTLTVINPPSIAKAFGASTLPLNGTTSLAFTITNANTASSFTGLAFTDSLPAGLVVATPSNLNSSCGGTATAVAGSSSASLSGGTLAAGSSCTVSVNVQGTTGGVKNNSVTVSSTNGGTGNTSNASITVVGPPAISKAFGAASIPLNGSTSLSFTIQNPNITTALTGVAFSDTLPAGLVVSTPNGLTGTCGSGTIAATAGGGTISLSGGTIAANSSCTFSINVTDTTAGAKNNTTGNVTSTEGGAGGTASASVNVVAPPSIAKGFNPTSIAQNATTSLTFTITNPAANAVSLTGVAFTDTIPTGLTVANASATVCGGTLTDTAPTGIALTGATIAANSQCQFSVTVTGAVPGSYTNTTGNVTSTNGGTGNTASANLTVVTAPPVITKAFGAASIPLNGTTSLSFTIQNNNSGLTLHGVGFTDTFPAGLVVSAPNGLTGTCGGGTISATAGGSGVSLTGATLAGSSSCTFAVNVTGTTAGLKTNTTGNVTSTEGGNGGTATASIKVEAPPSIAKVFNPTSIALNATTSLTFTITNPAGNVDALTGVAFTDTLPTGLTIANASATVCGGTLTTTVPTGIALTGATIAVGGQCQFSVTVTGATSGQYTNTTGNVTSTNGGTGNTASANLNVGTPPSITKTFNPIAVPLNGSSTLSFTINNPNTTSSLTGVAFTDSLPAGLVISTPNGLTGSCGGGTITATAGSSSVSLSGATMAASASCTLSVKVTPTTGGVKNNTVTATAAESGAGLPSNATLTVTAPPTLAKIFGALTIPLNGTTTLTFTATNPNTVALTGVGFTDTLPAGLAVASPNGLTGSCGGNPIAVGFGTNSIILSNQTIAASVSCTFSVNVTGTTAGTKNNTTGNITSTEGGTGGTASASINIVGPPFIAKAFNPSAIGANGVSTLTFTLTNPAANGVAEAGVAFTDTLPAGLVVATPSGLGGSCTGTATATPGSSSITFSGGSIPVNSSCTVAVNVTGAVVGIYNNTTGAVSSTNGGAGNTASATLTIAGADLTITKTHTGTFNRGQNGATYTVVVVNSGAGPTNGTVTVVDSLPAFMLASEMSGTGWTCTLNPLSCTRSDSLAPGASYPPITVIVNIGQNIANTFSNTATVSGGGETNTGNDTAVDTATLGPPIVFQPLGGSQPTSHGNSASMQFNLQETDSTVGLITFGCTGLPANSSCTFDPPTTSQSSAVVTMTVSAAGHGTSLTFNSTASATRKPRFYAALVFPVFGLVGIAFGGRNKKMRLRLIMLFMGLIVLLGSIGCGGLQGVQTPAGAYKITVTATSTSAQVSVPVTLTIR